MARVKNKHGLTHQQELFCQYVVDAYGSESRGILLNAYRKAYNCKNDSRISTHYDSASKLMKNPEITHRIDKLREEQERLATINRERIISDDVHILDLDPLDLWIEDPKKGWRMRYLHEIPKATRKLLKFVTKGNKIVPDVDKDAARKRLIEVLGFNAAKDINFNTNNSVIGELRFGFGDEE